MTARVCPVHGEYAADGVCRWCEQPKPSGADQSTITLPLGCICQKCLRMFDAPIPLTSLLCPECRGKAQPTSTDVVGESPGARALLDVKHIAGILGDPHPRWDPAPTFTYAGEDATAVHWILDFTPAICPEDLMAAFDAEVAAQHAALRWERVERRWANKHGPWTLLDFAQHWQFFLNKLIALQLKRIAEIDHPLVPVPPKEPKP